jgi:hypothetical protein
MFRLGLKAVVNAALLSSMLACRMDNPAFDFRETESVADGPETTAEGQEGQESNNELGDGDGDSGPETGDGDPTTSGDGDGEPTTSGDGDGEPTTTGDGDGEPSTTGDGDGDPTTGDGDGDGDGGTESTTGDGDGDGDPNIALDMMAIDLCPNIMGNDDCQMCAAQHCCFPGAETCFEDGSDCKCIVDCLNANLGDANQCGENCQAELSKIQLASQFSTCMEINCGNFICG